MEDRLKEILTKPVMDETMDQKIAEQLLNYDTDRNKKVWTANWLTRTFSTHNSLRINISKVVIIIFALFIIGGGTALAARWYVKSYPAKIIIMNEDDIDLGEYESSVEHRVRKSFGTGNRLVSMLRDRDGNIYEVDENGYYIFEDGSKNIEAYIPDPNRHENDRKSGDEAFAEMGFPNLVPTYLYDNYILGVGGYSYMETYYKNGSFYKTILADFFKDGYDTGDFTSETIFAQFSSSDITTEAYAYLNKNDNNDTYRYSSYTNKNGILCTIVEKLENVAVHIVFESEQLGNGDINLIFKGITLDKIKEILDTIPLTAEMVD